MQRRHVRLTDQAVCDDEPGSEGKIFVGKGASDEFLSLALALANRHGLATGATGTGKTVTLQVLAEGFSRAGIPVFAADIKGDLSGIAARGEAKPDFVKRAKDLGFDYEPDEFPVIFWDLFGEQGHPIRATVFEMGPLLVSQMLSLNDVQEGIINIAFRYADDDPELKAVGETKGLIDLKDLRELLSYLSKNSKEISARYGNVAVTAVGAVQRQLLVLENQGGTKFFGMPALTIEDLMKTDPRSGRGYINVLAADKLMANPRLYATFLLWLLSEMFEKLPEVGDPAKPNLVFFFDEAHLLFSDAPKELLDKVEQVVRLIRSKGVGVYFVTQNPVDVPDKVLAQLGNRVQHALRAFTPADQKAVKAAADTFRPNPKLNTAQVITELGKGEALVSFLEGSGTPVNGRSHHHPAAVGADRAGHGRRTQSGHRAQSRSRASTIRPSTRTRPLKYCKSVWRMAADFRRQGMPAHPVCPMRLARRRLRRTRVSSTGSEKGAVISSASAGRVARL